MVNSVAGIRITIGDHKFWVGREGLDVMLSSLLIRLRPQGLVVDGGPDLRVHAGARMPAPVLLYWLAGSRSACSGITTKPTPP